MLLGSRLRIGNPLRFPALTVPDLISGIDPSCFSFFNGLTTASPFCKLVILVRILPLAMLYSKPEKG